MNRYSQLLKVALWVLLFVAELPPSVSAQTLGVIIADQLMYRARLRKTGYDKWDVTLERGRRSDFAASLLSSDILAGYPLSLVSPRGLWATRDRVFLAVRPPSALSPPGPLQVFDLVDYPLFDPARYQGDWMVNEGERNKRGEIRVLSPEERQQMKEAFRKAFQEGKVRNARTGFHENQRCIFHELIVGVALFPGERPWDGPNRAHVEMAPTKSLAFVPQGADDLQIVLLTTNGDLCTFPCARTQESRYVSNAVWVGKLERLGKLSEAERVFISADRYIGVAMPGKLLVYARQQDGWANTATEEGFEATACIWDWDTDEFLLVDKGGEKFYRLGGTEADKPKPVGRIDDAARQQTLKDAWAITKLPATRPE